MQLVMSNRPDYGTAPVTCCRCTTPMLPNPKGTVVAEWFVCDRCATRGTATAVGIDGQGARDHAIAACPRTSARGFGRAPHGIS
jgi:hypothetical protein